MNQVRNHEGNQVQPEMNGMRKRILTDYINCNLTNHNIKKMYRGVTDEEIEAVRQQANLVTEIQEPEILGQESEIVEETSVKVLVPVENNGHQTKAYLAIPTDNILVSDQEKSQPAEEVKEVTEQKPLYLSTAPHKKVSNLGRCRGSFRHDFRDRLGGPIEGMRLRIPFDNELQQLRL